MILRSELEPGDYIKPGSRLKIKFTRFQMVKQKISRWKSLKSVMVEEMAVVMSVDAAAGSFVVRSLVTDEEKVCTWRNCVGRRVRPVLLDFGLVHRVEPAMCKGFANLLLAGIEVCASPVDC